MSSIELPHWLMIAGALLVVAGVVGLALSRNKEDEADPVVLPGDAPWRDVRSDCHRGLTLSRRKTQDFHPIETYPAGLTPEHIASWRRTEGLAKRTRYRQK